jgi:hypothetical protein
MPAADLIKKVYKPSLNVGQVYAKPYGSAVGFMPIGNVLELQIDHKEDVQRQDDMTQLGGGTHAEVRRVTEISGSMKLADVNIVNLARAVLGTTTPVNSGTVTGETASATRGGLIRLAHILPTAVIVKKASVVIAATEYEVRPEGIYLLPTASGVTDGDPLTIDYSYGDQAVIEALTTKAPELALTFGGLNEADGGNPVVVDIWRLSQGVTKQLSLINSKFGALDVNLSIMQDSTKVGAGISRYYRTTMV